MRGLLCKCALLLCILTKVYSEVNWLLETGALVLCLLSTVDSEAKELRMLGMLPTASSSLPLGGACLPAIRMALDDINARADILDGYKLTYEPIDSKCHAGTAVYRMLKKLEYEPPYVMISGPVCSIAAVATAELTSMWNISQISVGAASPTLSDKKKYPSFFRLSTPAENNIPAMMDLMKKYNWKKAATSHQAVEFLSVLIDVFTRVLEGNNYTLLAQEVFLNHPEPSADDLKKVDARIIFPAMYANKMRRFLCQAYKVGLYGEKIVWLLPGGQGDYWRANLDEVDCTLEQMMKVMEGAFLFLSSYRNPLGDIGIANLSGPGFDARYTSHPMYEPTSKNVEYMAPRCYDHIWIAALAMNCTVTKMKDMGYTKTLDEFTYSDGDIFNIIIECMKGVFYIGVSGRYTFTNGDPTQIVHLARIQDGELTSVAYHTPDGDKVSYKWIEGALKWKDGKIPRDSTIKRKEEKTVPNSLYITMCSLAGLGIVLTIALFMFSIMFRSNRIVKLSSPNINIILLFGCLLCYVTVFFKLTETDSKQICRVQMFCFCVGFTITFGSLFSKTWRVYRIFTNKKLKQRTFTSYAPCSIDIDVASFGALLFASVMNNRTEAFNTFHQNAKIPDMQLIGVIGVLVALVLTILVIWEVVEPHYIDTRYLLKEVYTIGNDVEVYPYVRVCNSDLSELAWTIYILEGALLSFGAFLAWETRNVKIEALNDSHQIGLCLYNVVILSAVGLTLSLLLDNQVVMLYGVTSGCLIIGTFVTQCLVFLPKVRAVYNKTDDILLSRSTGSNPPTATTSKTGNTVSSGKDSNC